MGNNYVRVSRGFLVLCDECLSFLNKENFVNNGISQSDDIVHDLCPNCSDYNRPLIDDLLGSAE